MNEYVKVNVPFLFDRDTKKWVIDEFEVWKRITAKFDSADLNIRDYIDIDGRPLNEVCIQAAACFYSQLDPHFDNLMFAAAQLLIEKYENYEEEQDEKDEQLLPSFYQQLYSIEKAIETLKEDQEYVTDRIADILLNKLSKKLGL